MSTDMPAEMTPDTLQAFSDSVNFARHIGIELLKAEKTEVAGRLPIAEALTNHLPNVHGGAIMSLADALGAIGAHLNLPDGANGTTTIESKTNFIKAAMQGDTLHAVSRPLSVGRRLSVWQTEITRDDGARVAMVTQTQIYL